MTKRLFALLALVALVACTGCMPRFDDDVELTYETDGEPAPAKFGEDVRALVLRRLGAAQIGADVTSEGRRLRVVVEESLSQSTDELLTWTGTIALYEPEDGAPFVEGTREEIKK